MYTTMFSLLLASAGMASDAQFGGYGGYGSLSTPGSYGGCGGYPCYPYLMPQWSIDLTAKEDPVRREQDKRLAELNQKLRNLEAKVQDHEKYVEMQRENVQANLKLQKDLAESIAKINDTVQNRLNNDALNVRVPPSTAPNDTLPRSNSNSLDNGALNKLLENSDLQLRKFAEMEGRIGAIEERERLRRQDANTQQTNEVLQKMIDLMTAMNKQNPEMIATLVTIKDELRKVVQQVALEHHEVKIRNEPMKPGQGYPVTRGLIIVNLPADAKLFLDGMASTIGTNLRTFISPDLEPGKNYFYNLRVEVERNGKVYADTQKIYFQAGREVHVSFDHIETAIANASNMKKD